MSASQSRTLHRAGAALLAAASAAALAACAGGSGSATTTTSASTASQTATATGQAAAVKVAEAWAKAADTGMTAAFGILSNIGTTDVTLVSASSPASAAVQLHETVTDASGGTSMRQRPSGLVIPAASSVTLAPGGDHLMLMDLATPLKSGTETTLTLTFSDGSTLPMTAEVRTFGAAQESYDPSSTGTATMGSMSSGSHG